MKQNVRLYVGIRQTSTCLSFWYHVTYLARTIALCQSVLEQRDKLLYYSIACATSVANSLCRGGRMVQSLAVGYLSGASSGALDDNGCDIICAPNTRLRLENGFCSFFHHPIIFQRCGLLRAPILFGFPNQLLDGLIAVSVPFILHLVDDGAALSFSLSV